MHVQSTDETTTPKVTTSSASLGGKDSVLGLAETLPALFFSQAKVYASKPLVWHKKGEDWVSQSWSEIEKQVIALAGGLMKLGLKRGDRVLLVSENRPEWLIADLAIMSAGGITVPAYTTNTETDHRHVLSDSEAAIAIVSTEQLGKALLPAAMAAPNCKAMIAMEDLGVSQSHNLELHRWDWVSALSEDNNKKVSEEVAHAAPDDTACFIYTSGTGGAPKGVMLSHRNILVNCASAQDVLKDFALGNEIFLSFLPLSHAYEHTAGQFFPISIGAEIYYAESVEKLVSNLAEVRPTIMTAVPRLYESIHQRIERGLIKQSAFKQKMFRLALELGRKRYCNPASLTLMERIKDFICEKLVRKKVRQRFGGRLKAFVSGGAALNAEIGIYFTALGVHILQGYGQTEAGPLIACNRKNNTDIATVGPALKHVEIKIADDGEILVKGDLIMKGYWRLEEATNDVLKNGWLHTGDIGTMDDQGRIRITDRKKDIVVLSGGDNISPARIEGFLTLQPEIEQAMVTGDKRPHLVALLIPDELWLAEWARAEGKPSNMAELKDDPDLRRALSEVIERVNQQMSHLEKVRRFMIANEPFSIQNGMMTPTLKIRRHIIRSTYGDALDALYGKPKGK